MNKILFYIGIWILLDGVISFIYFKDMATNTAQTMRIARMLIGAYLIYKNK